jgi:hypothetical protein
VTIFKIIYATIVLGIIVGVQVGVNRLVDWIVGDGQRIWADVATGTITIAQLFLAALFFTWVFEPGVRGIRLPIQIFLARNAGRRLQGMSAEAYMVFTMAVGGKV